MEYHENEVKMKENPHSEYVLYTHSTHPSLILPLALALSELVM